MKRIFEQLRRRKDAGFGMVDTIIGMAVGFILLAGGGLFYVSMNQNASATSSIQEQGASITQSMNRISQTIQVSNPILFAADNEMVIESVSDDGEPVITRWVKDGDTFYQQTWTGIPGAYPHTPAGESSAAASWIEPSSSSGTAPNGDGEQSSRIAVTDLRGEAPIFEYFDGETTLNVAVPLTAADGGTNAIKRVGIQIGADTVRDGFVKNSTSATPRNTAGGVSDGSLAAPICPAVTATSNASDQPVLTWPLITGASEYVIYRNSAIAATVTVPAGNSAGTWTDTSGTGAAGDAVLYRVLAKVGDELSDACRPVTWRAQIDAPAFINSAVSPSGTEATAWEGTELTSPRIDLEWTAVEGASGYELFYRSVDPVTGDASSEAYTSAGVFDADTTTYTWDGAGWGQRYEWYVKASSRAGQSSDSATIQTLTHPDAPTGASISAEYGTGADKDVRGYNVISWNAVPSASGYQVYRYDNGSTGTATLVEETTALQFADTVDYGTEYTYYVVAQNEGPRGVGGSGAPVNEVRSSPTPESAADSLPQKLTQLQYPPIPAIDQASTEGISSRDLDGENRIVWGEAKSAEGYHAMKAGPADSSGECITGDCAGTSGGIEATKLIDDVNAGTQYDYFVKAYNATGMSVDFSEKVRLTQRPAAPDLNIVQKPTLQSNTADFSVRANADAGNTGANRFCTEDTCRYQLLRGSNAIDTIEHVESGAKVTWENAGNKPGDTITYKARSHNPALTNNGWSEASSVTVKTYPGNFGLNKWIGNRYGDKMGRFEVKYHNYNNEESVDVDGSRMIRSQPGYATVSFGSSAGATKMKVQRFDRAHESRSSVDSKGLPSENDPSHTFSNNRSRIWSGIAAPGATYQYRVTATAPNGLKRVKNTGKITTPADLPRYTQVMSICSGYGRDQRTGMAISNMNFKPRYGDWTSARVRGFEERGNGSLDYTGVRNYYPSSDFRRMASGPGKNWFEGIRRGFDIWTNGDNGPNSVRVQFLEYQFAPYSKECAPEGRTGLQMNEPFDACYGADTIYCRYESEPHQRYNYRSR